jgi:hypothetical protein
MSATEAERFRAPRYFFYTDCAGPGFLQGSAGFAERSEEDREDPLRGPGGIAAEAIDKNAPGLPRALRESESDKVNIELQGLASNSSWLTSKSTALYA